MTENVLITLYFARFEYKKTNIFNRILFVVIDGFNSLNGYRPSTYYILSKPF